MPMSPQASSRAAKAFALDLVEIAVPATALHRHELFLAHGLDPVHQPPQGQIDRLPLAPKAVSADHPLDQLIIDDDIRARQFHNTFLHHKV